MKKRIPLIAAPLILIIIAGAFVPCLKNGFTNWDDDKYVTENRVVQNLSFASVKETFSSFIFANYHPFTIMSLALEYRFFKRDPFFYHLTNLILHLCNSLLVLWFFCLLTPRIGVALLAALLFGIHPLHVEAVAWISGRKELLYAFFYLASLICYCYYARRRRAASYYLCLSFFLLALLSKAMAVTLPLVLLLIDYVFERQDKRRAFIEKIPFIVLSLVCGVIAFIGQYSFGAVREERTLVLIHKFLLASYALMFYVYKTFIPLRLSCFYPYYGIAHDPLFFFSLISFCAALVLSALVIISGRYTKKIIFGALFFLVTLLPALQFVRVSGAIVADRYAYMPTIGLYYIIGVFVFWVHGTNRVTRVAKGIFSACVITALLGLCFLTWQKCGIWKDSVTLWSDALKNTSSNAKAYNNLCQAYIAAGRSKDALPLCRQAMRIDPADAFPCFNLGWAYETMGRPQKALALYRRALALDPEFLMAANNLASLYAESGHSDEAIALWTRALEISPQFAVAHYNLAKCYFENKHYEAAIEHCDKAVALGVRVSAEFLARLEPYRKRK